jgi:uncharacterized membrane protein
METLYFILCSYGLTQILVYSRLLSKIRPGHYFFHCPMCVGFWVGALLVFLNPFTELFTFDVSAINLLLLGWLSSGTSYALCMLISDGGFQYEYRIKGSVDSKMDAKTSNQLLQG